LVEYAGVEYAGVEYAGVEYAGVGYARWDMHAAAPKTSDAAASGHDNGEAAP